MAITYPLTLPSSPLPRSVRLGANAAVAVSRSPFTFRQQTQVHGGEEWLLELDYDMMGRADAETLIGFLLSLNGREGTFLAGDPLARLLLKPNKVAGCRGARRGHPGACGVCQ
jgi:hypothetical protein